MEILMIYLAIINAAGLIFMYADKQKPEKSNGGFRKRCC